jgi:hypothetical protein
MKSYAVEIKRKLKEEVRLVSFLLSRLQCNLLNGLPGLLRKPIKCLFLSSVIGWVTKN